MKDVILASFPPAAGKRGSPVHDGAATGPTSSFQYLYGNQGIATGPNLKLQGQAGLAVGSFLRDQIGVESTDPRRERNPVGFEDFVLDR